MLTTNQPQPVKVFAGVLWTTPEAWRAGLSEMEGVWGEHDLLNEPVPFTFSDYYRDEMGPELQRQFAGFSQLVDPGLLPQLKLQANEIEARLAPDGKRTVNIDVGYVDYHKVVLASTKAGPQKIYLAQGIWADMVLMYRKGEFHTFPWSFADFAQGAYDDFFLALRQRYKSDLNACKSTTLP